MQAEKIFLKQNSRRWKSMRRVVYSRVFICALMVLLQAGIFLAFVVLGGQHFKIFMEASFVLGILFAIFLSNVKGKNEFKMAWLIPVLVFPIFGIALYLYYKTNRQGKRFRRNLKRIKEESETLLIAENTTEKICEKNPEVAGLCRYLLHSGHYPSFENSATKYYPSGEEFLPEFLDALKSAREFIFMEYFIVAPDESWLQIVEVLKEKAKEGVEIRVMYDAVGSVFTASKAHQKFMESLGIKARTFLPLVPLFATQQNNRDHRKITVIDGRIAFTGGLNIAEEYFNLSNPRFGYWKDTAIKIEGPAIKTFTTLFLQSWNLFNKKGEPNEYEKFINRDYAIKNDEGFLTPYGDDAFNNEDIAENVYNYILNSAQKKVCITTPYIIIDDILLEALTFAAKRGVDVSIIVPASADHFVTFCIGKVYLKKLIDAGVNVYLYQKGFIHAKMFVADSKIATIGTINLDYRSLFHHFECGTLLYKNKAVYDIENDFEKTLSDCTKMTADDYKKLPKYVRFIGRIGKIFAPLL